MAFFNTTFLNIYFMVSTFILGILCFIVSSTAWPFFRGAMNCNVKNPSSSCKDKKKISYGLYVAPLLLAVSAYFAYIRISSEL